LKRSGFVSVTKPLLLWTGRFPARNKVIPWD
jgi:hypothetical protein